MKSSYIGAMRKRLRPLILSLLFLVASLGLYQLTTAHLQSQYTAPSSPAGTWRQYVVTDGQAVYLGTFTFEANGDDFAVCVRDLAPYTFPQSGYRTFGHSYSGSHWQFRSDWHEYGIAQFELTKVGPNRFEGYTYLNGRQGYHRHILIRVQ